MKIYMLLMLVGVIVGFSYIPSQRLPKQTTTVPPDSATACSEAVELQPFRPGCTGILRCIVAPFFLLP